MHVYNFFFLGPITKLASSVMEKKCWLWPEIFFGVFHYDNINEALNFRILEETAKENDQ